ncbi:MAG TPA: DEAD/DEAH box helicase [Gammaproteobacteria bacterium]|nr:DEAD/DEAH box helicase [Gammaproteobacteria bacterium]
MTLNCFHPAVTQWFKGSFLSPTPCQKQAWPAIRAGQSTLIAAPTGSGKTLAAFLVAIDDLVRQAENGTLVEATQVVYISPLKALSNDIQRNLEQPLRGILEHFRQQNPGGIDIRTMVRTGDTSQADRQTMRKRPPHIVVTTPESFYILLTSEGGRRMLSTTRTVIVDELHAVAGNKRGAHLALSLERLDALVASRVLRIGLSATQCPIIEIARFLVGGCAAGEPPCTIINTGYSRARDLAIELPRSPLQAVMSNEVWQEVYDRLAELILAHRTTLVFVNTRRMAERVTRHLSERIGGQPIATHHGSLAREHRLQAEQRLKAGRLRALVATASLELGIDIGEIELVCQLGSTRAIATVLQRVGRSGHGIGGLPKGRLFPLSRDDLIECVALLDAVHRGELDCLTIPKQPLDVLAQQIVAIVAAEEWSEEALYRLVRRAYPYRDLIQEDFKAVVRMLAEGFSTRRGRRGAYLHQDAVNKRLRARRGTRLIAITSGGAIPELADYEVRQAPTDTFVGSVNEDFAIESLAGDIFQLGNTSWRVLQVEGRGVVWVQDVHGQPPTIPFWFGEAPARTAELSTAVSRLRAAVEAQLTSGKSIETVQAWLSQEIGGIAPAAAHQILDYLASGRAALGVMPTQDTLVMERFFDESGGMQLVLHAPFGSRLNRAWGLALRKRFCRKFNFELQAAATEDAVVLSLGEMHSFPLTDVWQYLNSATVREVLIQALLDAPMFTVRWRWNATVSLAVPRCWSGKRVPPRLQRIQAQDLLGLVFPDQQACIENLAGAREIPDHPLVHQTLYDGLTEAMDIDGLEKLLKEIECGKKRLVARDLTEPSPLAQEILTAKPYAFLDDAPLEERRTQVVISRRWLDPDTVSDLGWLDPAAIERVKREAWPAPESADELHEALVLLGFVTEEEAATQLCGQRTVIEVQEWLGGLISERRATVLEIGAGLPKLWVVAERLPQLLAVHALASMSPPIGVPQEYAQTNWSQAAALVELVRSRLEGSGPVTAAQLADCLGVTEGALMPALLALEGEGFALRGSFTEHVPEPQWCERRLLARIHRYTLKRLRQEIEPVSQADFMRFLFHWHHLGVSEPLAGPQALNAVLEQLTGFIAPAAAWEADLLPARVSDYQPAWLDSACLSGRVIWRRLTPLPKNGFTKGSGTGPIRTTPIALLSRAWAWWQASALADPTEKPLTPAAQRLAHYLHDRGASFFQDFVDTLGLLRAQVEEALAELVNKGMVSSDSFAGLRALLVPAPRRGSFKGYKRRRIASSIEDAGRWALVESTRRDACAAGEQESQGQVAGMEAIVWTLLRRYGVICRQLLEREPALPPWRELLKVYRRLEARGEIRGGRFVAGMSGEQFALPEAVGALRDIRRQPKENKLVSITGADPLNLVGVVTPGARVPALVTNRILYRDGVPIALQLGREIRLLDRGEDQQEDEWTLKQALIRRSRKGPVSPSTAHRPSFAI